MSKKTWILISCLVLSLTLGLGGSLAYLTDSDTKVNTFSMGDVDIKVEEDFQQDAELKPGVTVTKKAQIVNEGNNDAFVWMTVAVPAEVDPGCHAGVTAADENGKFDISNKYVTLKFKAEEQNSPYALLGIKPGPAEGQFGEGDFVWYYTATDAEGKEYHIYTYVYMNVLKVGESTDNMLESVTLNPFVNKIEGNYYYVENGVTTAIDYNLNDLEIIVTGHAIQAEGFGGNFEAAYKAYGQQWGEFEVKTEDGGESVPATEVSNVEELVAAINKGGKIRLTADIAVKSYLAITNNVDIDLNGNDLSRIDGRTLFFVDDENAELLIRGEGNITTERGEAVYVRAGVAKIEGGTFTGDSIHHVYVQGTGRAEIFGGTFHLVNKDELGLGYVLNKYDADRATTSIKVFGGDFLNWNPANNGAEGAGTNFVGEDSIVVSRTDDEDTWYIVWHKDNEVPEDWTQVYPVIPEDGE